MALSRAVCRLAARTVRNDPRIGDARTVRSTHGNRWRSRRVVARRANFLDEPAGRLCGRRRRPACVLRPCPFRRVARLSRRTLAVLDRREFRILEHSVASARIGLSLRRDGTIAPNERCHRASCPLRRRTRPPLATDGCFLYSHPSLDAKLPRRSATCVREACGTPSLLANSLPRTSWSWQRRDTFILLLLISRG